MTKDKAYFKKMRHEMQPIVKGYSAWLHKHVGKRCKTYCAGCFVCDCYHALDILKSL